MKRCLPRIALALLVAGGASAHAAEVTPTASRFPTRDLASVDAVLASPLDLAAIGHEDAVNDRDGLPRRFAIADAVRMSTASRGTWEQLPNGDMLWRLRVLGREGSTSLNLGFSRFRLPAAAQLLVYSADGRQVLRPFTAADNEDHGELWTPVIPGRELVIELTVPADQVKAVVLELGSINQGYRGFGTTPAQIYIESGACNMDVECLDANDPWRTQMRAVAVYQRSGLFACTGSLINNTANDLKMYFLTANHCGVNSGNAATVVAYWNYQNSFCRTPGSAQSGQTGDGSLAQFHTGSIFRANSAASDMTLVEFDDPPVPAFNHFWEGWDNSSTDPACSGAAPCTGIHHPGTEEKRITYILTNMVTSSWNGGAVPPPQPGDGTHLWVHWATDPPGPFTVPGVTEGGSSGSPLYNAAGRVVGQLHGGLSGCGATGDNLTDMYGRFSVSWTGGGTDSTRLVNWLDPLLTGTTTLDGINQCTAPGAPTIGTATATGPNAIQVTWSDGAPSSTTFNVYRAIGTCAAPGPFSVVGPGVAGSPFNDATVSGGTTYAYRVTGRDATGACESSLSTCVQATATGACTMAPTFAGLASATNNAAANCGITLAWAAATANCGGPITYNVYRSTTSGFVPGPANQIASGLSSLGYVDTDGALANGTTYYYVVRAVDGTTSIADANTVEKSAAVTGPIASALVDTFEGAQSGGGFDVAGWTHSPISGATDWAWSTAQSQTPTHSWFSDSQASDSHRALVTPTLNVTAGSTVSFWHTFAFEGSVAQCYDAGTLEVSTNGGGSWAVLPDAAFTAGGFNGTVNNCCDNPLEGLRAWCSGTVGPLTQVTADLTAYAGPNVKLRWRAGDDFSVEVTGWYVDSVNVSSAAACVPGLFTNGFEEGVLPGPWGAAWP